MRSSSAWPQACGRRAGRRRAWGVWAAGGAVYAAAALFGPALLRRDPQWGVTALLFLFATVWATDILAFFSAGRSAVRGCGRSVSPNKTWAGAVGGLLGGLAAGVAVAYASGVGGLALAGVMGLVLSVLAQAGDLLESAVKRQFGAKDASQSSPVTAASWTGSTALSSPPWPRS